ncbi:MAG: hypothetical protein AB1589_01795 [Cyanobacteriota bacterium]
MLVFILQLNLQRGAIAENSTMSYTLPWIYPLTVILQRNRFSEIVERLVGYWEI